MKFVFIILIIVFLVLQQPVLAVSSDDENNNIPSRGEVVVDTQPKSNGLASARILRSEIEFSLFSAAESFFCLAKQYRNDLQLIDMLKSFDKQSDDFDVLSMTDLHLSVNQSVMSAVDRYDLWAYIGDDISWNLISSLEGSVVLRIRPALDAEKDNYYVVLDQIDGQRVSIIANGGQRYSLDTDDLRSLWDGSGMIISNQPIDLESSTVSTVNTIAKICVFVFVCIVVIRIGLYWYRGSLPVEVSIKRSSVEAIIISVMSGFLSVILLMFLPKVHFNQDMPKRTNEYLTHIDFRDANVPVNTVSYQQIDQKTLQRLLIEDQSVIFVDARSRKEYNKKHIKDSVVLSGFDGSAVRLCMAGIPKNQMLVVFCISANCGRGKAAASALVKNGFTNVMYYPPGWLNLRNWELLDF